MASVRHRKAFSYQYVGRLATVELALGDLNPTPEVAVLGVGPHRGSRLHGPAGLPQVLVGLTQLVRVAYVGEC